MRRVAGGIVLVVGLGLIASLFALHIFTRTDQAKKVLNDARPTVTGSGIKALRSDLTRGVAAVGDINRALPEFASRMGLTPDAFQARYPALQTLLRQGPELGATTNKIVTNLERHEKDFKEADSIPTKSVSVRVMPWVLLGVAVVLAALGASILLRSSALPLVLALLVGAAMVAAPLALRIPQKSAASADVLDSLNAELAVAVKTRQQFTVVSAGGREIPRILADVAAASNVTVAQLQAEIASRFPDLSFILDHFDELLQRFGAGVRFREKHHADIADLQKSPIREGPWFQIGAGAIVALSALGGLVIGRRRD